MADGVGDGRGVLDAAWTDAEGCAEWLAGRLGEWLVDGEVDADCRVSAVDGLGDPEAATGDPALHAARPSAAAAASAVSAAPRFGGCTGEA